MHLCSADIHVGSPARVQERQIGTAEFAFRVHRVEHTFDRAFEREEIEPVAVCSYHEVVFFVGVILKRKFVGKITLAASNSLALLLKCAAL